MLLGSAWVGVLLAVVIHIQSVCLGVGFLKGMERLHEPDLWL